MEGSGQTGEWARLNRGMGWTGQREIGRAIGNVWVRSDWGMEQTGQRK